MFNWFKRTPKETPLQLQQRLAAERMRKRILGRLPLSPESPTRRYTAPVSSPAPAPSTSSTGFDPLQAAVWYSLGSSSHSHSPSPAPEPERFVSGGGGDYGGGGASGSWESSSSSCSSSSSSSDYSSSSSSDSGSSSCGSSD